MMARRSAEEVQHVAVIGGGTIGASWAACFLAHGLETVVVDPLREEFDLRRAIDEMWPALERMGLAQDADPGRMQFSNAIDNRLAAAQFVQESVPEQLPLKRETLHALEAVIDPDVIVSSSATALMPSEIQAASKHPQRVLVGHPFNPPHLIPLVEVVGGSQTAPQTLTWAMEFYRAVGKVPVLMKKEAVGHIANRLTAALFREAVHLVAEGITTVEDIDEVITQGPGLRWALQGPFTTYHLAGGPDGIAHYMQHLGPTQEARWRTLGDPRFSQLARMRDSGSAIDRRTHRPDCDRCVGDDCRNVHQPTGPHARLWAASPAQRKSDRQFAIALALRAGIHSSRISAFDSVLCPYPP